jgi:hypothetical protein
MYILCFAGLAKLSRYYIIDGYFQFINLFFSVTCQYPHAGYLNVFASLFSHYTRSIKLINPTTEFGLTRNMASLVWKSLAWKRWRLALPQRGICTYIHTYLHTYIHTYIHTPFISQTNEQIWHSRPCCPMLDSENLLFLQNEGSIPQRSSGRPDEW